MEREEIKNLVSDTLEKRFESYAQTQIKLHKEYHEEMLSAVEVQIKSTVNGKIDKIQKTLDDMQWLADFTNGAGLLRKPLGWLVMFILGAVALLGGFKSLISFFIPK